MIKIYKIISEQLKIEEPNIDSKSNIIDDLGADSLDMVELCMDFEDEFNIEILDEEIEKLPPIVEDIVNFIINKINQ
ncbi:MAG: acyl carrier protein [Tissierellia bacterium]|nr:acyl carrier protein [Tissierellia bacterium]MDD4779048.1 acyl carrier protein [Tissierellia bacterium]